MFPILFSELFSLLSQEGGYVTLFPSHYSNQNKLALCKEKNWQLPQIPHTRLFYLCFWKIVFLGIEFSVEFSLSAFWSCATVFLLSLFLTRNCTYFCFSVYNTSFSLVPFSFFSLVSSNLIVMYLYVIFLCFLCLGFVELFDIWSYSFYQIWQNPDHYLFKSFSSLLLLFSSLETPITHIVSHLVYSKAETLFCQQMSV